MCLYGSSINKKNLRQYKSYFEVQRRKSFLLIGVLGQDFIEERWDLKDIWSVQGSKKWEDGPDGWNSVNKGTEEELCKGPSGLNNR